MRLEYLLYESSKRAEAKGIAEGKRVAKQTQSVLEKRVLTIMKAYKEKTQEDFFFEIQDMLQEIREDEIKNIFRVGDVERLQEGLDMRKEHIQMYERMTARLSQELKEVKQKLKKANQTPEEKEEVESEELKNVLEGNAALAKIVKELRQEKSELEKELKTSQVKAQSDRAESLEIILEAIQAKESIRKEIALNMLPYLEIRHVVQFTGLDEEEVKEMKEVTSPEPSLSE